MEASVKMSGTLVLNHLEVTHRLKEFMSNYDVIMMD